MHQKVYLPFIAAIFALIFLSSCSSLQEGASLQKTFMHFYEELSPKVPEPSQIIEEESLSLEYEEAIDFEVEKQAEELTMPEPEETIAEEVKDLESLGIWEEGKIEEIIEEKVVYDFPVTVNRQVEYYLDFFQHKQKNGFARWLARSGRYMPMITSSLEEANLPLDLVYLAMIESGYSVTAYSRSKAVGLWQFMRATAVDYGLNVDNYVDERRDPILSTQAAIRYLTSLHKRFDSWHLAVAAYNAGEGKINKGLKKYKTNNFWELAQRPYLRLETKRYVPKLIAAIMIARNPEKYGFDNIKYQEPMRFETVKVPGWTSLRAVAVASKTDLEEIRGLNRQLRKGITPPELKYYELRVPVNKARLVEKNLPRVHVTAKTKFKTHTIRKGDTLNKICKKYDITKTTLLKANNLRKAKLTPGKRLRIPHLVSTYTLLSAEELAKRKNQSSKNNNFIVHTIKPGETVSEIAQKYSVSSQMIVEWNNLTSINRIRAGQKLTLYGYSDLSETASTSVKKRKVVPVAGKTARKKVIAAAKTKKAPRAKKKETYYMVQGGDSLWTIARKFKLSTVDIKKWNKLRGNLIHPGLKLLLKIKI